VKVIPSSRDRTITALSIFSMLVLAILICIGMGFLNQVSQPLVASDGVLNVNTDDLDDHLYLLGGDWTITENQAGSQIKLILNLETDQHYGLYIRSLVSGNILGVSVNGTQIPDAISNRSFIIDLDYENDRSSYVIAVEIADKQQFQKTLGVFLGTESMIQDAWNAIMIQRLLVVGYCLAIIFSSFILYINKKTEKYLLVLALLMLFTVLKILGYAFNLFENIPIFGFVFGDQLIFVNNPGFSYFINQSISVLIVTHLRCGVFEQFVSVKIGKIKYVYFVDLFVVLMGFILMFLPSVTPDFLIIFIYIIAFAFEAWAFSQWSSKYTHFAWIFVLAWSLTVSMYLFNQAMSLGFLPMGVFTGLVSFPTYHNIIYTFAFLFVTNTIYSSKFQQADILSAELSQYSFTLENTVKERTEELKKSLEQLELTLKQKNSFIQVVAHNIKTPLFTISGSAEMTKVELARDQEKAGKNLDTIIDNISYVNKMIEKLMLISRLESGAIKLIPSTFDLCQLLNSIQDSTNLMAIEHDVSLINEYPKAPVNITADEFFLRQAIQNIVDNAIESCDVNGRVELTFDIGEEFINIFIRDNGSGISPNELENIFAPNYSKNKNKALSTGMGLSIAQRIVELHHGQIKVDSVINQGSVFQIILPIDPPMTFSEP